MSSNPPSKKLVEDFIRSFQLATTGYSAMGEEGGTYVCSFRFADLRRDGFLSLVAGIGIKDRPSCSGIEIIDRTDIGFESYGSAGEIGAGGDISSQIQDLRRDGRLEFFLNVALAVLPQQCVATWTAIYAWTGDNYTNVSSQFKDFYTQRLDSLRKIIPALQPYGGPEGDRLSDQECLAAEASAIERFLGVSPDAGLDEAVRLSASKDRLVRQFGTVLLLQIGTPGARRQLQKLVKDSDYAVATYAKNGLSKPVRIKFAPPSFQRSGGN